MGLNIDLLYSDTLKMEATINLLKDNKEYFWDYKHIFLLVMLVICLVSVWWICYYDFINVNKEKPLFEKVIERFAEVHNYNLTTYNCVNYSQDLKFILNNLGYRAEGLIVENGTLSHEKLLLILEVEPQTGEITIRR